MIYRYETHVHTSECDRVAALSGEELVLAYREAGYHGMIVTDHYFGLFFDWFADELTGTFHTAIIDRWLLGYRHARVKGQELGFTVLPGAEVRIDGSINDYLLYGMTEEDFYRLPLLNRQRDIESVIALLPPSVLTVQAHPFRNAMTVRDPAPLFGIESFNGGTEDFRNRMAETWAVHYAKAMTSGSDCHGPHAVGLGGIETDRPILTPADLTDVLRRGEYSLIRPTG